VNAVQLSQVGALVAWSIGADGSLACTDITTCQIRTRMKIPSDLQSIMCHLPGVFGVFEHRCLLPLLETNKRQASRMSHLTRQPSCVLLVLAVLGAYIWTMPVLRDVHSHNHNHNHSIVVTYTIMKHAFLVSVLKACEQLGMLSLLCEST
jgi:hypothetical protein